MQPGAATRVRTWTPLAGPFHGFLITHGESISIADYLSIKKGEQLVYRPTVHYAYHPSNDAVLSVHELAGNNWRMQDSKRIMMDEIVKGIDELGVLLAGHKKNAYWYGSQLSIQEARQLAPHNSATSLQVTVSAMAGLIWAIENPNSGIVEPDDHRLQAHPRDLPALSRAGRRRIQRLAPARRSQPPVPGRPRRNGSLAVQEHPRGVRCTGSVESGVAAQPVARVAATRVARAGAKACSAAPSATALRCRHSGSHIATVRCAGARRGPASSRGPVQTATSSTFVGPAETLRTYASSTGGATQFLRTLRHATLLRIDAAGLAKCT